MPDNHRKALSDIAVQKLDNIYYFEYDKERNIITTRLTTCKKATEHDASKPFHINAKKLGRKVVFSMDAINIWKGFQNDKKLCKFTLFQVNNAVNKLKIMYQIPDRYNVSEMLKTQFSGIKHV